MIRALVFGYFRENIWEKAKKGEAKPDREEAIGSRSLGSLIRQPRPPIPSSTERKEGYILGEEYIQAAYKRSEGSPTWISPLPLLRYHAA
jgi:hypothetical protein